MYTKNPKIGRIRYMWKKRRLLYLLSKLENRIIEDAHSLFLGNVAYEKGVDSVRLMLFYIQYNKWYWLLLFSVGVVREGGLTVSYREYERSRLKYKRLIKELDSEYIEISNIGASEYVRISPIGAEYIKPLYFWTAVLEKFKIWQIVLFSIPIGLVIREIYEYISK